MATSSGLATVDWLGESWLKYQEIKHQVDIPTRNDDKNVPDRVDLAYGVGAEPPPSELRRAPRAVSWPVATSGLR